MFHVCLEYVQHLCNAALSPVKMFWQLAILLPTVNYLLHCSPIRLNKLILVPWTKISSSLLLFLLCFLACFEQENIWTELLPKCTLLSLFFSIDIVHFTAYVYYWVKICTSIKQYFSLLIISKVQIQDLLFAYNTRSMLFMADKIY